MGYGTSSVTGTTTVLFHIRSDASVSALLQDMPPRRRRAWGDTARHHSRFVPWTADSTPGNYFTGGTKRVPSLASLLSWRLMSFPIASIRLMLFGLNCGSYGLRAGPPATSSTASNL